MQDYSSSFSGVGAGSSSPTPSSYHSPSLPSSHIPNPAEHSFLASSMYAPSTRSVLSYMPAPLFTPQSPSPPAPAAMWHSSGASQEGAGGHDPQSSPYSRLQPSNNSGSYFSR